MKKHRRLCAMFLFVLMVVSLTACGTSEGTPDSKDPGSDNEGNSGTTLPNESEEYDPDEAISSEEAASDDTYRKIVIAQAMTGGWDLSPFGVDGGRMQIVMPLYGRLATITDAGANFDQLVGDIAKTMTLSDDGLTCSIEIYDYVHDNRGNPITAKDVEECYNYALTLDGRNDFTRIKSTIESVTATGDYTLEIKATSAGPTVFPNILVGVPIVNWEWFEGASEEERINNPAVTGAYYIAENVG